jgi:hypothetical protein
MSTPSRMNACGMCQSAMERWMGGWQRRTHLRKHFTLVGLLGGSFLTRTQQWEEASGYPEGAIWLSIYALAGYHNAAQLVWPVQHQLARLREVDSDLPGFVYYGLIDTLRLLVNVYDWRDAQSDYERDLAQRIAMRRAPALEEALRIAAEMPGTFPPHQHTEAEPKDTVPRWLGTRSRLSPARARVAAAGTADQWVRKVVDAVAVLKESAANLDRKRLAEFPFAGFGDQYAGALDADDYMMPVRPDGDRPQPQGPWPREPDGPPALLFTMTPHDEIEGYAREALRQTAMYHYYFREVRRHSDTLLPVVPAVCIGMNYTHPPSLHRGVKVFQQCCEVLERASYVLDLLRKAKARVRVPISAQPERVLVTV